MKGGVSVKTFGRVRAVKEESRQVEVVVSTETKARDDAVIHQDGWDLDHYGRNPVVLWAHDIRSLPIAKTVETRVEDKNLIQVHEFAEHSAAEEVFQAVRSGFVNATSVRWLPGDYEWRKEGGQEILHFTRGHQLLEVSYVPVPSDPGALVVRDDGGKFDETLFPKPEPQETRGAGEQDNRALMAAIHTLTEKLSK